MVPGPTTETDTQDPLAATLTNEKYIGNSVWNR